MSTQYHARYWEMIADAAEGTEQEAYDIFRRFFEPGNEDIKRTLLNTIQTNDFMRDIAYNVIAEQTRQAEDRRTTLKKKIQIEEKERNSVQNSNEKSAIISYVAHFQQEIVQHPPYIGREFEELQQFILNTVDLFDATQNADPEFFQYESDLPESLDLFVEKLLRVRAHLQNLQNIQNLQEQIEAIKGEIEVQLR